MVAQSSKDECFVREGEGEGKGEGGFTGGNVKTVAGIRS